MLLARAGRRAPRRRDPDARPHRPDRPTQKTNRAAALATDITRGRQLAAQHRGLWKALRERGRRLKVVAVARTREERSRARTMLDSWAREPDSFGVRRGGQPRYLPDRAGHPSGDDRVLGECGNTQAGLERIVESKERARRQAGRGPIHRVATRQSVRLTPGGAPLRSRPLTPSQACARHVRG